MFHAYHGDNLEDMLMLLMALMRRLHVVSPGGDLRSDLQSDVDFGLV